MLKKIITLIVLIQFFSCKYRNPVYSFTNFDNTNAERIAYAIKSENIKVIKKEALRGVDINSQDSIYNISLLDLSIANKKKDAFLMLLKLGANLNIRKNQCTGPIQTSIQTIENCNLFYLEELLKKGAQIDYNFSEKCKFENSPILSVILYFNDVSRQECCKKILKLLVQHSDKINLNEYNNIDEYYQNIIFNCLITKNIFALKYLIVDLSLKPPSKIFVDSSINNLDHGYYTLDSILHSKYFTELYSSKEIEKNRNELLEYLNH